MSWHSLRSLKPEFSWNSDHYGDAHNIVMQVKFSRAYFNFMHINALITCYMWRKYSSYYTAFILISQEWYNEGKIIKYRTVYYYFG